MTSESTTMVMAGHAGLEWQTKMASLMLSNEQMMVQITIIGTIATTTQWEAEVAQEAFVEGAVVRLAMATHVVELDLEAPLLVELDLEAPLLVELDLEAPLLVEVS